MKKDSVFGDPGLDLTFDAIKYPIVNGGVLWILGLALLELLPYGGSFSWILAIGVSIAIIKSSLWGGKTMPRLEAFLPAGEFLALFGKALGATLVVVWPFALIYLIKYVPELGALGGLTILLLLAIFFFLYFLPAALVSLARGDGIGDALTPVLLRQLIREHAAMYQPAALLLCVGGFLLMFAVGILNAIPHVGAVLGRAITIWFQFTFARAFGVMYLLPRAERIARRLSGNAPASAEEEPEPTSEKEATPEDGPAPAP